jgi:hypothetical protein
VYSLYKEVNDGGISLMHLKEFAIMNPYWISDVWDEWVMYQNHSLEVPLKTWEEWLAERSDF